MEGKQLRVHLVVEPRQGNSGVLWNLGEQSPAATHIPIPFLKGYGELFSDTQAQADGSLWDLLLPFQANTPLPASFPSRCKPLSGLELILMGYPARKWSGVLFWIALTWIKSMFP